MENMDVGKATTAEAPAPIITRAINRLVGNVDAINGCIKALEEKLAPVMRDNPTASEENIKDVDGTMGVPIAVELQKMSVSLEDCYKRLDDMLQLIEL